MGPHAGTPVLLPRIKLAPTDSDMPITRRQFPVRLAFAMTINKSQGQTFERVALLLEKPVFSHGQLYVAISRVGDPRYLKIFLPPSQITVDNVVYSEVLQQASAAPQ